MTNQTSFEVRRLPAGVTMIREADHREDIASYLVEGSRDVAVIDTGLGSGGFPEIVANLSSRRPLVLQTHLHWDHVGASQHFADVRTHAAELAVQRVGWPWEPEVNDASPDAANGSTGRLGSGGWSPGALLHCSGSLQHGARIDLGGRSLEVIHTPGHSPGSLSFLDRDAHALFSGDLLYFGQMLLFVSESDPVAFRHSLHALAEIAGDLTAIYPAHGRVPLTGDDMLAVRDAFEQVWNGKAPDWHGSYAQRRVAIHDFGQFAFLLPPGEGDRVTG